MATTLVLSAYSIAYPNIDNRIRVDISAQRDPDAIVASEIDDISGHPARIWNFAGLPRDNYIFEMNEIDGSGNPVRQLAYFDVEPGILENILVRGEEQVEVDVTPGLVSGTTFFVFDGTSGKPDWRGWEISPEEYSGVGTMIRGVDYSWDKVLGRFDLLESGAIFANLQWYTVEFESQAGGTSGGSIPLVIDFEIELITSNTVLTPSDFGKKIIAEPAGNYMEITLPPINTVVEGRAIMIETKNANEFRCVKIIQDGSDIVAAFRGNIYMMCSEKIRIYKFIRSVGVYEWRVDSEIGNFWSVGSVISEDMTSVYNKIPMDGRLLDIQQYARLYNEVVLNLPLAQQPSRATWESDDSKKTYFSLASSSQFHVPDRRGQFALNSRSGTIAGVHEDSAVGSFELDISLGTGNSFTGNGVPSKLGKGVNLDPQTLIETVEVNGGGRESAVPNNYTINKYILV